MLCRLIGYIIVKLYLFDLFVTSYTYVWGFRSGRTNIGIIPPFDVQSGDEENERQFRRRELGESGRFRQALAAAEETSSH